jgi:hypothetical protein
LQAAIPGFTELDAQWLVTLPTTTDSPLPAPLKLHKRKALASIGPSSGKNKRSTASQSVFVRRSPRSHSTSIISPIAAQDTEAPSLLAASHHSLRPQLSRAFRQLYGTASAKAYSFAGLTIRTQTILYCEECLGTGHLDLEQPSATSRDPLRSLFPQYL